MKNEFDLKKIYYKWKIVLNNQRILNMMIN